MTLAERIFAEGRIGLRGSYVATWAGMAVSGWLTAAVWFVPKEDWEHPAGPWVVSLMGLALFVFSLWGNRYFGRRLRERRTQQSPAAR